MQGKIKEKGISRVSVYFNEQELQAIALEAEKAGFRRVGIPIKKQLPHGFSGQWVANTDGIGVFLKKKCFTYWVEHHAERLQELAELTQQEKELAERKKRLGGAL